MPSKFLYHVTPVENLESILETGLTPRAGKWHGPRRIEQLGLLRQGKKRDTEGHKRTTRNLQRALDLVGRFFRTSGEPTGDGYGWYWFRVDPKSNAVRQVQFELAKLGYPIPFPRLSEPVVDEWPPQISLATSLMAAYEVAREFTLDKHHGEKPLTLLAVSRSLIPGSLATDAHIHVLESDRHLMRVHRKLKGSLMTKEPIPVDAIKEHSKLSVPDLLDLAEFRRWMGTTGEPGIRPPNRITEVK
jgi:hypothetical protein